MRVRLVFRATTEVVKAPSRSGNEEVCSQNRGFSVSTGPDDTVTLARTRPCSKASIAFLVNASWTSSELKTRYLRYKVCRIARCTKERFATLFSILSALLLAIIGLKVEMREVDG